MFAFKTPIPKMLTWDATTCSAHANREARLETKYDQELIGRTRAIVTARLLLGGDSELWKNKGRGIK